MTPLRTDDDLNTGLAEERTHLAWRRSGLALVACGVVVFRQIPGVPVEGDRPIAGVAILALGVAAWFLGVRQARMRQRETTTGRPAADPHSLRVVAYGTAAIAVAAFLVGLLAAP